jgi:hypothetical protein
MIPDSETLRAWRRALIVLSVVIGTFFILGLAQRVFLENMALPITEGLSRLALIFAVVIVIDALATGILGVVEAVIERITGDSATFQNGKLVAVRREEILQQRAQERAKQAAKQARQRETPRAPAGPPSIYALPLPIPGAPGREVAEPVMVSRDPQSVLRPGTSASALPGAAPKRVEPSVIAGTAVVKTDEELEARPLQEAKIDLSEFEINSQPEDDEGDEDDGEEVPEADEDSEADDEERL